MEFEVVTDICVTCVIYWKEQRVGLLLTPLFFTTASLFVPLMSMGTGVPLSFFLKYCALEVTGFESPSNINVIPLVDLIAGEHTRFP